jgi:nucleoside-diphosphate-sugar epimerase
MKIIVTGCAGRIGRYVVRDLCQAGHEVTGIDIVPGARHLQVDLTDAGQVYGAFAGAEAVAHIGAWANAGIVPDTRTYGDNVSATYNVFQACADLGISRVVSASSAQVYGFFGRAPEYAPVDENHPVRPLNSYAASKIAGEQAATYFHDRFGLQIASFRFMGVRTPAEMPPQIAAMQQDPGIDAGLLWTRTDTRDAATACRLALESTGELHGIYNITGPEIVIDMPVGELLSRHCPATELRADGSGRRSPLSCDRAAQDFDYRPVFSWTTHHQHPEPCAT